MQHHCRQQHGAQAEKSYRRKASQGKKCPAQSRAADASHLVAGPSIPTAVAWELPEISVLMARNIAAPVTARNRVCLTTGVVVICAN